LIGKYRQDLVLQAIKLPRSTFNYGKKRLLNEEKISPIEACIKAIFEENQGNYGYRRIKLALAAKGYQVNHKKVRQIMKNTTWCVQALLADQEVTVLIKDE
jgi:putative transposase